jgi:hypothetical protein
MAPREVLDDGGAPRSLCARRRVHRAVAFVLMLASLSGNAWANFTCAGQLSYLGLGPQGEVFLSVQGFGVWAVCNMTGPTTVGSITITPDGCKGWYASLLAAQKAGHSITLYFSSAQSGGNGPECTALGSWVTPNPLPYHLHVMGQ